MDKKSVRRHLLVANVSFALAGTAGVIPAFASIFLFDAPGSENNAGLVLLGWSLFTFPVVCGLSIVISRVLHAAGRDKAAWIAAVSPLLNVLAGAVGVCCLYAFHGGRFNG